MKKSDTIEYPEGSASKITVCDMLLYKLDPSHIRTIEDVKKVLTDFKVTLCIHEGENPPDPKYWKKD